MSLMNAMNSRNLFLLKERVDLFNSNTKRYCDGHYINTWIDEFFSLLVFGSSPDDYFRYEFYKKSFHERNKFITWLRSRRIIKRYNDASCHTLMNDKRLQNAFLEPFLGREWLDLSKADNEMFHAFLKKHDRIIMKPYNGSGGRGIFILDSQKTELNTVNVSEYKSYIAEELLIQHPDLARLNPSSVNTLRVMTFKGEIISATLKVGQNGAVVDNMCSNGLYGNVDLKTGITDSWFMNISLTKYAVHPETGEKLIGFTIPYWNLVQNTVKCAVRRLDKVQYVGWDIAVLTDGVAIIEANQAPGHDLSAQSSVQRGLYSTIRRIIKKTTP